MRFFNWISNAFKGRTTINVSTYRADQENAVAIEAYAVFTVVEMIAGILSKCEFKTYRNGEEFKGREWFSLNVSPNINQNSTEFWMELFCKLLYYQEVLVVDINGQKIIADDFVKEEFAVRDTLFTQVTRGTFTFSSVFKASDVFYLKYTNNNVTGILNNVFTMYQNLISDAAEKYKVNAGEKGVLKIQAAAQGTPDFENKFKDLMENRFKTYFKGKNAVLPLYNGMEYSSTKKEGSAKSTDIADIKMLFDEALSRAAQAYKLSPVLVKGEIAGIEEAFNLTLTSCIDPLANMASEEMTRKEFKADDVIAGNYIDADTTCIKHIDIFDAASSIDKLVSSAFATINEVRCKAGLPAIQEEWANKHYITKNYQSVDEMEGGENNE